MNNNIITIENALKSYIPTNNTLEKDVINSIEYSLLSGGKRIRPLLTLEFAKLCGGTIDNALPFACAVEMIHSYSLIHDDLPCMDNDELRHGKPANHIIFGEAIALLAGDALQSLAFETIASTQNYKAGIKALKSLSAASGALGMVGGQVIDLQSEGKTVPLKTIKEMYCKKTGALIISACEMGCISANGSDLQIKSAIKYAQAIGLAFQIEDDILDIVSNKEKLGKPIGSDTENKKSTFVSSLGLNECKETINILTESALLSLENFDGDTEPLKELARSLSKREN